MLAVCKPRRVYAGWNAGRYGREQSALRAPLEGHAGLEYRLDRTRHVHRLVTITGYQSAGHVLIPGHPRGTSRSYRTAGHISAVKNALLYGGG